MKGMGVVRWRRGRTEENRSGGKSRSRIFYCLLILLTVAPALTDLNVSANEKQNVQC